MTHTGKEFGVDLYGLEQVAKSDLPTVAGAYESAAGKSESAHAMVNGLPREPGQFVSGQGSVFDTYNEAHAVVVDLLKQTRTNLDDTAEALREAAADYAERDRVAAEELQRIIEQQGEPKPE
ncbi:hypothetical protein GIY23_21335 [Allosaccharopolyspora coralli]|uniref:ESX-1 secretion-associated protein n=1 Tax=Allosaccharopolyspora coralli TaxID=2665642 RepID=A0A5Q3QJV5_9PSEU|nr:hypothetical protein [Allosaccharopolyspora coralli]QGK71719.1 hypothetical protein GIY23_21335 [Allosaccharopolyspora coralli]